MRKKHSHIDLLHMIDGVEMQKATAVAGNRCYYLKVRLGGGGGVGRGERVTGEGCVPLIHGDAKGQHSG